MVNKSTKESEKKAPAEEVVPPSGSAESEVINNAGEEAALQPQVTPDEKSHGDAEQGAEQVTTDAKTSSDKPAKKSRGRPKKSDNSAPPVKKAKKEKERPSPARTSARVKNQRDGVKLDNTEELPERKRSTPAKKVAKNGVEQNGTAVKT